MKAVEQIDGPEFILIHYGKEGALGSFQSEAGLKLCRGDRVVVQGERGAVPGTVLGPASVRQSRLLGNPGQVLRRFGPGDEAQLLRARAQAEDLFRTARSLTLQLRLDLEVLDVDVPLDAGRAILHLLLAAGADPEPLLHGLQESCGLEVLFHNLAGEAAHAEETEEEGGCGKPDCGKKEGGGCTSCSSGGCATGCGSKGVDMRDYFGHLRGRMEEANRVPLL